MGGGSVLRMAIPKLVQAAGVASGVNAIASSSASCAPLESVVHDGTMSNVYHKDSRCSPDTHKFMKEQNSYDDEWTYVDDKSLDVVPTGKEIASAIQELHKLARPEESDGGVQLEKRTRVDGKQALVPVGASSGAVDQPNSVLANISRMLQQPGVQNAVESLAKDRKVLAAMKENPAVQALFQEARQTEQSLSVPRLGGGESSASSEAPPTKDTSVFGAIGVILNKIIQSIGSLFGSSQPPEGEKSKHAKEENVGGSLAVVMGIVIVVVLLVVVKRPRI